MKRRYSVPLEFDETTESFNPTAFANRVSILQERLLSPPPTSEPLLSTINQSHFAFGNYNSENEFVEQRQQQQQHQHNEEQEYQPLINNQDEEDIDGFDNEAENARTQAALQYVREYRRANQLSPAMTSPRPGQNPETISVDGNIFSHELFIDEVRKYQCLWNVKLQSYKEQPKKKLAWKKILESMNNTTITIDYLKAQWKSIRDSYRRCLANRKTQTRSGASGKKLSKCKFFDNLVFLNDVMGSVPTESNIDLNLNNTSTMHSDESSIMSSPPPPPESLFNNNNIIKPLSKRPSKKDASASVDLMLIQTLKEMESSAPKHLVQQQHQSPTIDKSDSDSLFCQSLVEQLKSFSSKKNKLARVKIQQVLYEIEFSIDIDSA